MLFILFIFIIVFKFFNLVNFGLGLKVILRVFSVGVGFLCFFGLVDLSFFVYFCCLDVIWV